MKNISKEYFAVKSIQALNGLPHFNRDIVKGAVDMLKENYGYAVKGMTDDELLAYVLDEVRMVRAS